MTKSRIKKLRRLVRVTEHLYRQNAAELARLGNERVEKSDAALDAEGHLANLPPDWALLHSQAIGRAARLRTALGAASNKLAEQSEVTGAAMSRQKSAELKLKCELEKQTHAAEGQAMESILDSIVRDRKTSSR